MSSIVIAPIQVSGPSTKSIRTFEPIEFAVTTGNVFQNPFDPDEVNVMGSFQHGAERINLPAFWDGKAFRLRFTPPKPGTWHLSASVSTASGAVTALAKPFVAVASHKEGFVRASAHNPRYLQFDSGKTFYPIGLNLCWPDATGLPSYDKRFESLKNVGGNFARIWTTQDHRLETEKVGLGKYDTDSATHYDKIFELAEKHGINTMLTFDDYRVLAKTDYFNAHWDKSPYNAVNGGPLKEPTDFFKNAQCRKLYKQRLRYLVARYSAYTSLGFWELYNEQDNIPKPGVPTEWFREMTSYLASIDPYHHIITTSYSWDDKAEIWECPALGLTQRHMYGQGDTIDFVSMIEENSRKLDKFGKPRMIGEFGITWKEPDIKLDKAKLGTPLHDALWATVMTGDSGGALTWWWDNYLEPLDLWHVYIGISKFVAPIDFAHRNFRPIPLHAEGLTVLGLQDARKGETIFWLHDPNSTWKADADNVKPKTWSNTKVAVPASRRFGVEVWDTRTGKVISHDVATARNGMASVSIPEFQRDIAVRVLSK